MNFSDQPPSKQWAALKYKGEKIAEVWFKPDGEPRALALRIPQKTFELPGMAQQLTLDSLLRAMGLYAAEVESWRYGDSAHAETDRSNSELKTTLPPPPHDLAHLDIRIRMMPPTQGVVGCDSSDQERSAASWQDLEARWKAILGLEATMDALRISMEGLQAELQSASARTLTAEAKLHALRADIAAWSKAKSRVHHALPKLKEIIHRCTWALGAPERKKLEELYKNHIRPHIPFPELTKTLDLIENMLKDRQVLAAHGASVYQECKSIAVEVQGALRTLESNAARNAHGKRVKAGAKGKFF